MTTTMERTVILLLGCSYPWTVYAFLPSPASSSNHNRVGSPSWPASPSTFSTQRPATPSSPEPQQQYPPPFRTSSKQPKKVIIDPKTGLYRPMKYQEEKKNSLTWDGFKSFVYDGVDLFSTKVPETIQKIRDTTQNAAETPSSNAVIPNARDNFVQNDRSESLRRINIPSTASSSRTTIFGGYKDREEEFINTLKDVPSKRLTQEFKVPESVNERISDSEADDVLVESSPFESFKSLVYKGIDVVSTTANGAENDISSASSSSRMRLPINRLPSSLQTREVQARLLASDEEFLQALEELQSDNAVVRLAAGYKVRRMVEQDDILKKRRMRAAQREEQVVAIKSGFYKAGDALVGGVKYLVELPPKVVETYENTVTGTKRTVETARSLPQQVKQGVESVQLKVGEARQNFQQRVESTNEMIEKTKQLPSEFKSKVQETRESVQKTAKRTKEVAATISETAKEITTTSRVWLGLEKPLPKPPKALPSKEIQEQEISVARLGWKALAATGSFAGKVGWALGKETTKLAWKGAELAWARSMKAIEDADSKDKQRRQLAAAAFKPSSKSAEIMNATQIATDAEVVETKPKQKAKQKKAPKETTTTTKPESMWKNKSKKPIPSKKTTAKPKSISKQSTEAQPTVTKQTTESPTQQQEIKMNQKEKVDKEEETKPNARSSERLAQKKEEMEVSVLDLEQEIAEALRLAEVAIESAKAELDDMDGFSNTNGKDDNSTKNS